MLKPKSAVVCWFVTEDELQRSLGLGKPYVPSSLFPYAYFQRVNKPNDDTIEGYLGHSNLNGGFHDQITSGYGYFNEYVDGVRVCITFDKVTFYRVAEIFPSKPLLFTIKKINKASDDRSQATASKLFRPLHFEDLGWEEFERLVFAYVSDTNDWNVIQWLGQTGGDGGRDIWGVKGTTAYCYQCANYKSLPFKKATDDIDKLLKKKIIPDNFIVVCGGRVSANMRTAIHSYAAQYGIKNVDVWSGAELEEKLRKDTPELVKRFF